MVLAWGTIRRWMLKLLPAFAHQLSHQPSSSTTQNLVMASDWDLGYGWAALCHCTNPLQGLPADEGGKLDLGKVWEDHSQIEAGVV